MGTEQRSDEHASGSFEETHAEFECKFAELLNQKNSSASVLEYCRYEAQGDSCVVRCEYEGS